MFFTDVIASRLIAAGIQPVAAVHRNREVMLLYFDASRADLAALVKGSGGRWSVTRRCWYLPPALLSQGSLLTKLGYPLPAHLQAEVQRYAETLEKNAYSKATIRNYTACLLPFLFHFREASQVSDLPDTLIGEYFQRILRKGGLAQSTVNMHINAIKLFYGAVCGRPEDCYDVLRVKKRLKPATVFSKYEVHHIISAISNLKHRAMIIITYMAGLSVSEAVRVRIKDIDSEGMLLHVRQGAGKNDRQVSLSGPLPEALSIFNMKYRPKYFLFEGQEGGPYSIRMLQQILHDAKVRSGVKRAGSIHALRHSFAVHVLEPGVDLRSYY